MQIYNDTIFDLLDENAFGLGGRASLRLKEDVDGRVFVAGLCEVRQYRITFVTAVHLCTQVQSYSCQLRWHGTSALVPLQPYVAWGASTHRKMWCMQVPCRRAEEAMDAQRRGSRTRQKAGTALNYSSSRSHAVFTLALYACDVGCEQRQEVPA